MPTTVKTRSGRVLVLPTAEEDAAITAAALADPDALPYTPQEMAAIVRRGRPKVVQPKAQVTLRLPAPVVDHLRASGKGWQTRLGTVLGELMAQGRL